MTLVAIPDLHVPAHDVRAIDAICQWMKTRHIDALIQLGDLVDHESISRFVKDSPRKLAEGHLIEEWAMARSVMRQIVGAARTKNPECSYFQLQGNHDARTLQLEDRFPMLRGMFDLSLHLGLEDLRGTWVASDTEAEVLRFEWTKPGKIIPVIRRVNEYQKEIRFGASFVHGWKFNTHNARSTADLSPWPGPVIYGHTHTRQLFTGDQWGMDKPIGASCGWLGLPIPEYAKKGKVNRWEQAFGVVHMNLDRPGDVDIILPRVRDGSFLSPEGVVYSSAL